MTRQPRSRGCAQRPDRRAQKGWLEVPFGDGVGGAGPVRRRELGGTQVRARFHHVAGNGSGTPRSGLCSRSALRGYTTTLLPSGERRIFPATFSSPSAASSPSTRVGLRSARIESFTGASYAKPNGVSPAPSDPRLGQRAVYPCDDVPPWGNPVTGMNLHHPMMAPFLGMAANRAPPPDRLIMG
jgi:hypothetical protein